jgi:hypothetical protein
MVIVIIILFIISPLQTLMQCPKWEAGVTSIMHTPQIILGDKETSGITHKSTLQWYFDPHLNKIYVVSSFHLNKLQWLL